MGFVCAALYLFGEFFWGKATEHLLGEGIKPEHLNDDRLGRVLDKLFEADLTEVFVGIATKAAERFGGPTKSVHLDATSFHLHGRYDDEGKEESEEIRITYGYSREHRPDLKQFVVNLMSTKDGGVPNVLSKLEEPTSDELLAEYRRRQSIERGFRFLKDPLFFASSVSVKAPRRVAAIAMVMGLCLLV